MESAAFPSASAARASDHSFAPGPAMRAKGAAQRSMNQVASIPANDPEVPRDLGRPGTFFEEVSRHGS